MGVYTLLKDFNSIKICYVLCDLGKITSSYYKYKPRKMLSKINKKQEVFYD